jgi:E3 ubiquitin-protein ligase NEDD4
MLDCEASNGGCDPETSNTKLHSDSENGKPVPRTSACSTSTQSMDYQISAGGEFKRPNSQINKNHATLQRSISLGGTYPNISCLSSLKHNCCKGGPSQLLIKFASGGEGRVDSSSREKSRDFTRELSGSCKVSFL